MQVTLITTQDIKNEIQTVKARLPELPTGYTSWSEVDNRIEAIHANYSDTLMNELHQLEATFYKVSANLDALTGYEDMLGEVADKPLVLDKMILEFSNEAKLTLHSWEDFVSLRYLVPNASVVHAKVLYKCGAEGGAEGINTEAVIYESMSACGFFVTL